ncbi:MAG: (2Fe-2S)-binding protein [Andreesenia angusta]|nr:(2Fe-2S)-binding protein [Andreesenia angusta]
MYNGARTRNDLVKALGICNICESCGDKVDEALSTACKCKKVSMQEVLLAMKSGADTVEKIEEMTGAGSKCGKCKKLLENMIELGY